MTPKQIGLVQESCKNVSLISVQAAQIFYDTLFEMDPSLKSLFPDELETRSPSWFGNANTPGPRNQTSEKTDCDPP